MQAERGHASSGTLGSKETLLVWDGVGRGGDPAREGSGRTVPRTEGDEEPAPGRTLETTPLRQAH